MSLTWNKKIYFLLPSVFLFMVCPFFFFGQANDQVTGKKITPMDLSAEDFLRIVRNPPGRESWAKMTGRASHKRKNSRTVEAPLRLGILFTPARTVAQIVFDEGEYYDLGQSYGENPTSTLESACTAGKTPRLGVFGIAPQDLTMGFLYQPLIREEKNDSVRGETCRVFSMRSPDGKGRTKVYISARFFFPLKAEFFSSQEDLTQKNSTEPERTLEISGFTKENDFWIVKSLNLFGPDWRTRIDFDKTEAGFTSDSLPADVFLKR